MAGSETARAARMCATIMGIVFSDDSVSRQDICWLLCVVYAERRQLWTDTSCDADARWLQNSSPLHGEGAVYIDTTEMKEHENPGLVHSGNYLAMFGFDENLDFDWCLRAAPTFLP